MKLNSIGLENPGLDAFLSDRLPGLLEFKLPIIVNIFGGKIVIVTKEKEFEFVPFPPFMKTIIEKGGLKGWVMEKLGKA